MKHRRFILQEYDKHPVPGWHNLDGTIRYTRCEAKTLLKEFDSGKVTRRSGQGGSASRSSGRRTFGPSGHDRCLRRAKDAAGLG